MFPNNCVCWAFMWINVPLSWLKLLLWVEFLLYVIHYLYICWSHKYTMKIRAWLASWVGHSTSFGCFAILRGCKRKSTHISSYSHLPFALTFSFWVRRERGGEKVFDSLSGHNPLLVASRKTRIESLNPLLDILKKLNLLY